MDALQQPALVKSAFHQQGSLIGLKLLPIVEMISTQNTASSIYYPSSSLELTAIPKWVTTHRWELLLGHSPLRIQGMSMGSLTAPQGSCAKS